MDQPIFKLSWFHEFHLRHGKLHFTHRYKMLLKLIWIWELKQLVFRSRLLKRHFSKLRQLGFPNQIGFQQIWTMIIQQFGFLSWNGIINLDLFLKEFDQIRSIFDLFLMTFNQMLIKWLQNSKLIKKVNWFFLFQSILIEFDQIRPNSIYFWSLWIVLNLSIKSGCDIIYFVTTSQMTNLDKKVD